MNTYQIGNVAFDPDACEISAQGRTQHLQPQVRSVLLCLVKHPGEVVSRQKLVDEAWGGRLTSDESIGRCISLLRRHFDDFHQQHQIETIPKSGYRLQAPVKSLTAPAPHPSHVVQVANGAGMPAKTAVNLLLTLGFLLLLLSGLIVAADFFALRK